MKSLRRFVWTSGVFSILSALSACQPAPATPQTFNFNRPSEMAFVCLRVPVLGDNRIDAERVLRRGEVTPIPLNDCNPNRTSSLPTLPQEPGLRQDRRLFGVVTQSDRGELAVVNLHPTIMSMIVDNDPQTPGFSFIPTGLFPGAVSVDPRGLVSFVANNGEATVTIVDNSRLLNATGHRVGTIMLAGPPSDLVAVSAGNRVLLHITLPTLGLVDTWDVTTATRPMRVGTVTLRGPAGGGDGGVGTMDGGTNSRPPAPDRIVVSDENIVYVSDRATNWVHVLRANTEGILMETDPIDATEPTEKLVISPPIPGSSPAQRYLLAVSARDGSLMALDPIRRERVLVNISNDHPNCTPAAIAAAPTQCPRPDPNTAADRIPVVAPVRALTVVSRDALDSSSCLPVTAPLTRACAGTGTVEASPDVLRGLQVVVVLRTGALQVVDLYDPEEFCNTRRRFAPGVSDLPTANETLDGKIDPRRRVLQLRMASVTTPPTGSEALPTLEAGPIVTVGSASAGVASENPHLIPVNATTPGTEETCNAANDYCVSIARIAGVPTARDPLAAPEETWTVIYEGLIPGLGLRGGALSGVAGSTTQVRLDAQGAGFCRRGATAGDRFVLRDPSPRVVDTMVDAGLRPPASSACDETVCRQTFGTSQSSCNRELRVVRAEQGALVLDVGEPDRNCAPSMTADELRNRLLCCYPTNVAGDVRAGGNYLVYGTRSGFQHDVIEGPGGVCERSPSLFPSGRLIEDDGVGAPEVYRSHAFSLRVAPGAANNDEGRLEARPTQRDTSIRFRIVGGWAPLLISTPAGLPSAIRYQCETGKLYLLDQARASLYEYGVSPLGAGQRVFN